MTRPRLRPVPDPGRPVDQQVPPHSLEAEQAVLGAILAAGRLLVEVAGQVEETDFYRPAHRVVWRAINALADRGEPTDPITCLEELRRAGQLDDVGGGPLLHTLLASVPTVADAAHYARLVAELAQARHLNDLGHRLARLPADAEIGRAHV